MMTIQYIYNMFTVNREGWGNPWGLGALGATAAHHWTNQVCAGESGRQTAGESGRQTAGGTNRDKGDSAATAQERTYL